MKKTTTIRNSKIIKLQEEQTVLIGHFTVFANGYGDVFISLGNTILKIDPSRAESKIDVAIFKGHKNFTPWTKNGLPTITFG